MSEPKRKRTDDDEFFKALTAAKVYSSFCELGEPELCNPPNIFERVQKLEDAMERIELQCDSRCCCKQ